MDEVEKEYRRKKSAQFSILAHGAGIRNPAEEEKCCNPHCKTTKNVRLRPAATAYHWDGKGEDPNRPILLCDNCAEEYYSHYQELWDTYYNG